MHLETICPSAPWGCNFGLYRRRAENKECRSSSGHAQLVGIARPNMGVDQPGRGARRCFTIGTRARECQRRTGPPPVGWAAGFFGLMDKRQTATLVSRPPTPVRGPCMTAACPMLSFLVDRVNVGRMGSTITTADVLFNDLRPSMAATASADTRTPSDVDAANRKVRAACRSRGDEQPRLEPRKRSRPNWIMGRGGCAGAFPSRRLPERPIIHTPATPRSAFAAKSFARFASTTGVT